MSRYLNFLLGCSFTAVALAASAPAQSQAVPSTTGTRAIAGTYNFDVSNGSTIVDALITTNSAGHATGITGLVNGIDPITGLSTYAGADNNLYVTGAWVTFGGLSFSTRSLGDFNFYNSGSGYYGLLSSVRNINGYPDGVPTTTALVTPVPEPATWAMMLLGFCGAGAVMRRTRPQRGLPQIA